MPHSSQHLRDHRAAGDRFRAGGVESFALEAGDGEPVVCLHGVPVSAYVYRKVVPALAAHGLRGIAIDLPGLGLADRPDGFDYSWGGLGRWATAAVDALELDRFHLLVHDIGGPVGFELAAAAGRRVASLTLLNTVVDPAHFRQPWAMRPFAVPVLGWAWLHATPAAAFVRLLRWQGIADQDAVTDAELAVHHELLTLDDGGRAFRTIMAGFDLTAAASARYEQAIRGVEHRQVVWGDRDPALRYDVFGRAALRVADVPVATRLPAKHFLQEDHALQIADRVASLVDRAGG